MSEPKELKDLENPIRDVRNAIIYNIKQNTYVANLVKNFKLNEPIVYKTSVQNLKHFDCPAVGAFYPLELAFEQSEFAEDIKFMPGLFYIDVAVEDIDFIKAQDDCLSLALYIVRILFSDDVKPLPDENGKITCYDSSFLKITEIGSNPFKTDIVQFAYRIHFYAKYHWNFSLDQA